jgi:FkbM family methyltransferase
VAKSLLAWIRTYVGHALYVRDYFSRYYGVSKILRGILFFNYRMFRGSLSNLTKEHAIKVNGYTLLTIPNDQGISAELLIFKTHEPLTTELLKKELKKGMVCFDVGSNIGYYALLERKVVGSEGRVVAIEPSPLTFSYLKKNICRNGLYDIETFRFGLSNSDKEVHFLMDASSNWSRVVDGDNCFLKGTILKVPARSLDSFTAQYHFDRLDFLRMDVEGHELHIFNGGWHTIERFKPNLLMEIHKPQMGLKGTVNFLQSLKSAGYNVKYYIPRELNEPLIGDTKDIQEIDITQLIEKLIEGLLPDYFHLYLINTARLLEVLS